MRMEFIISQVKMLTKIFSLLMGKNDLCGDCKILLKTIYYLKLIKNEIWQKGFLLNSSFEIPILDRNRKSIFESKKKVVLTLAILYFIEQLNLNILNRSVVNSSIIFLFEPFHSLILANSMLGSDSAFASSSKTNSASWSFKNDIKVHAEDTGEGIIFNTQINVLLNTKTKTASIRKVSFLKLSILHLKTSFKNFISLISSDGHMNSNLFVSLNTETSDCISSS